MGLNKIKINDLTTINTGVVYDISKATGQSYETLADALGTDGSNVPSEVREGGMSVRFVHTSDNKYRQFILKAQNFSTNEADWYDVDYSGIFNVNDYNNTYSSYSTIQDAMYAIPSGMRKIRMVFIAYINNEWRILQFWGGSVSAWNANAVIDFISASLIKNGAIETNKIKDANITSSKIADSAVTSSKIANSAVTNSKIADGNITTLKLGDKVVTRYKIADDVIKDIENTSKILQTNYEIVDSESGYYINSTGVKIALNYAYLSNPFSVSKGQKIKVKIFGGTMIAAIAQDNGDNTYTALVLATGTGTQEYEYTAPNDMTLVTSSLNNPAAIYFYSIEIENLKMVAVNKTEKTFGRSTFSNDSANANGYYYSILDNIVNATERFKQAEVQVTGATTIHVCIFDESNMSLICISDVSASEAGVVTILPKDINYDFNTDRNVGIWFMTNTYPCMSLKNISDSKGYKVCVSIGGSISYSTTKDINIRITKEICESKNTALVDSLSKRIFPAITDLQTYINSNRDCYLPQGFYRIDTPITIPPNTHIHGIKGATILQLNNADVIFNLNENSKHI